MDLDSHSLQALDWPVILEHLASHACTGLGAQAARSGILAASHQQALRRYAEVAEVGQVDSRGEEIPVGAVIDVQPQLAKAARGAVLEPAELQAVARSLRGLWALRHWIEPRADELPALDALAQPIEVDDELLYTLEQAFDDSGQLADAAWPELAELRAGVRATRRRIQSILEELVKGDALGDALQDRYVTERGGRLVLPVKSARRSRVGIVHDTSKSGETAFVEPSQVVEPQNRLAALRSAVQREEHRILGLLSVAVGTEQEPIVRALHAATHIDLACARAALGRQLRGRIPTMGSQGALRLVQARHPVLALRGVEVVPNDLAVDEQQPGLVLTGPNAGGKTVALKTMGLAALFVRAGIPFPAREDSRVDFFEAILADVGDLQSVEGDLSTFSGHLLLLAGMLERAAPGALMLLDELAVGTDPAQGASLARAALEVLVERGARAVITTHFLELKALSGEDPRFGLMGAQYLHGQPTWRLLPDLVGQSHALGVARRMGLPDEIIQRAEALLGSHATDLAALMETVEQELQRVRDQAMELEEQKQGQRAAQRELQQREQRLAQRRQRLEQDVAADFGRRLREREAQVKRLIAALQADPSLRKAGPALQQLRDIRQQVEAGAGEPGEQVRELGIVPPDLTVGDRVMIRSLGHVGTVVTMKGPDRAEVEVGGLRSWLKRSELAVPAQGLTPPPASGESRKRSRDGSALSRGGSALSRGGHAVGSKAEAPSRRRPTQGDLGGVPTPGNSLDLRGKRLEESVEAIERLLDKLILQGEPVAFILHGHGTGALKQGIRAWAPRSRYVHRWRPGEEGEGGDAWTVIELA